MILEIALGIVLGVGILLFIRYGIEMLRLVPWELVGGLLLMALTALVVALPALLFVGTWTHPEVFEVIGESLLDLGLPAFPSLVLLLIFYGFKYSPAILLLIWTGVMLKRRYAERVWFKTGVRMFKAPFAKGWLGMPKIVAWPLGLLFFGLALLVTISVLTMLGLAILKLIGVLG